MIRVGVIGDGWRAKKEYDHAVFGYTYRMEGLQGAILRVKLAHLEDWTEVRRSRVVLYNQALAGASVQTARPEREAVTSITWSASTTRFACTCRGRFQGWSTM